MTVGYKIKKIRELKNYTQEYLADKLNMSVTGYGKIERDEVDVPFSRLEQIATVFGIKVEDITSFDEKHVFNIMYNKITGNDFNINTLSNDEKDMYKKTIKLLEDKISYQEEIIQSLRKN